ncbi:hypothetical protein QPK87_10555 [Kamptonema cortianum]|nr:hypothetical protein [Geitlerinema splendidum]MDK3157015.1 hypothetical protein [Kamptonema cortianum]
MRKWWILFLAATVVVGCAGTGSQAGTTGGSTTGTTTGTPGRSVPTITFPTAYSDVRVVFLSGQGRRAPGSQYAKLNNIRFANTELDQIPNKFEGSTHGTNIKLDGFTVNKYSFTHLLTAGNPGTLYDKLRIELWAMSEETFGGVINQVWNGPVVTLPDVPVAMPIVPGRQSTVTVYLNDAGLFFDGTNPVFNQTFFNQDNLLDINSEITGFLSDMVAFPLTGVANRPLMDSGAVADKLLVSGDSLGLGSGSGGTDSFDLYSPNFIESGVITNPITIPGGGGPGGTTPGTYTVLEPDPSVIPPTVVHISALQGTWRMFNDTISNVGTQAMIIFPTTKAGGQHQVVLFKMSGSTITDLWFGTATLTGNTGTFTVASVDQIDNGTMNNAATGTLTGVTFSNSIVKDGDYAIATPPAGFPFTANGTFAVYRM